MMGSGKSTLAPSLAGHLGRSFADADQEIERRVGRSIAEIFDLQGEAAFRKLEAHCIESLASGDAVVALGGGAMVQEGMGDRLLASGTVVYLRARPEVLLARIGDADERPLLRDLDATARVQRLGELLRERDPCYRRAHLTLDTDHGFDEAQVGAWAREITTLLASTEGAS